MDEENFEKKESFENESNSNNEMNKEDHTSHKMVSHKKHHSSHHSHASHKKSSDTITIKTPAFVKQMKKNPWMAATVVLAIILIVLLYRNQGVSGVPTGTTISSDEATQIVLDFASGQGLTAEHIATSEENGLYRVDVKIQGQEVPVYITKDGKNLVPSVVPINEIPKQDGDSNSGSTPTSTSVPKSARPEVDLFVMSHCPYGTQIEKGILPVVKELQDDIDFNVKFVYYAMHPTAGEVQEQLRQYCIQEEAKDKYLEYLSCFLETGGSSDSATEATSIACQEKVGINTAAIESCYADTDAEYDVTANLEDTSSWVSGRFPQFNIHKDENTEYGVQGSPTLVINGQSVSSARDAKSLLNTICGAFEEKPDGCDADMSSFGSPGPGFGFDTQGGSAAAAGCAF